MEQEKETKQEREKSSKKWLRENQKEISGESRCGEEKETKQETGLIDKIIKKVEYSKFSIPIPTEKEERELKGLQISILEYTKSQLQTYFKNEKIELKEAEIKRADEIENMLKQVYKKKYDVNTHFRDAISVDLLLKEIQAKLHQLNKDAKKILGVEK